eukprot:CFRG2105T1
MRDRTDRDVLSTCLPEFSIAAVSAAFNALEDEKVDDHELFRELSRLIRQYHRKNTDANEVVDDRGRGLYERQPKRGKSNTSTRSGTTLDEFVVLGSVRNRMVRLLDADMYKWGGKLFTWAINLLETIKIPVEDYQDLCKIMIECEKEHGAITFAVRLLAQISFKFEDLRPVRVLDWDERKDESALNFGHFVKENVLNRARWWIIASLILENPYPYQRIRVLHDYAIELCEKNTDTSNNDMSLKCIYMLVDYIATVLPKESVAVISNMYDERSNDSEVKNDVSNLRTKNMLRYMSTLAVECPRLTKAAAPRVIYVLEHNATLDMLKDIIPYISVSERAEWIVQNFFTRPVLSSSAAIDIIIHLSKYKLDRTSEQNGDTNECESFGLGCELAVAVQSRLLHRLKRFLYTYQGKGRALFLETAETAEQVLLEKLEPGVMHLLTLILTQSPPNVFLSGVVEGIGLYGGQDLAVQILAEAFMWRGNGGVCGWSTFKRFLNIYSTAYPARQILPDSYTIKPNMEETHYVDFALFVDGGEDITAHLTRHLLEHLRRYSAAEMAHMIAHMTALYFPLTTTIYDCQPSDGNHTYERVNTQRLPVVLVSHWSALFDMVTSYPEDPGLLKKTSVLLSSFPSCDRDAFKAIRSVVEFLFNVLRDESQTERCSSITYNQTVMSDSLKNHSYTTAMMACDLVLCAAQNDDTAHLAMHALMRAAQSPKNAHLFDVELLLQHIRRKSVSSRNEKGDILDQKQSLYDINMSFSVRQRPFFHSGVVGNPNTNNHAVTSALRPTCETSVRRNTMLYTKLLRMCITRRNDSIYKHTTEDTEIKDIENIDGEDREKGHAPLNQRNMMLLVRLIQAKTALLDPMVRDDYYKKTMGKVPSSSRDRHIWKILSQNPVLWSVLPIVAEDSESFAQLLWIVKSALVNLIGRYNRSPHNRSHDAFALVLRTERIMQALTVAEWIPKCLQRVTEVFGLLTCEDVANILSSTVQYLCDSSRTKMKTMKKTDADIEEKEPVSPAEQVCVSQVRKILKRKADIIGPFYGRIFST